MSNKGKHGNPNSLKNLRPPWKSGQSGNPGGRPKSPYTDAHRAIACALVKDLGISPNDTAAIAIAKAVVREALKGKIPAAKEAADRAEGTPTQRIEHSGLEQQAIKVEAKLSTGDLIGALRELYGLGTAKPTEGPAADVPIPGPMDRRPSAPKDSKKK